MLDEQCKDEEEVENIPCLDCGRTDLPLYTDYKCPNCSKYGKEDRTLEDK